MRTLLGPGVRWGTGTGEFHWLAESEAKRQQQAEARVQGGSAPRAQLVGV